jgi:F1F0 ATPase subunit 2
MTNENLDMLLWLLKSGAMGLLLGLVFFGGLWWTIQRMVSSPHPAILFSSSLLLRTVVVLGGFYFASQRDWRRMVACLVGFVVSRYIVSYRARRATHAPAKALPGGAS